MGVLEDYESTHQSFRSGSVMHENNETLLKHLFGLANQNNINEGTQHRDIIRGITINHILMQRHIDALNKQNAKTQRWVVTLAIASIIGTASQVWYADKADRRAEAESKSSAEQRTAQQSQMSPPTPATPPSTHPVESKASGAKTTKAKPGS